MQDDDQDSTDLMKCISSLRTKEAAEDAVSQSPHPIPGARR